MSKTKRDLEKLYDHLFAEVEILKKEVLALKTGRRPLKASRHRGGMVIDYGARKRQPATVKDTGNRQPSMPSPSLHRDRIPAARVERVTSAVLRSRMEHRSAISQHGHPEDDRDEIFRVLNQLDL